MKPVEQLIDAGTCSLFVRRVGDGPALVLVNGGPGMSHEYMVPLEAVASDDLCVVTYDQRGCGQSSFPDPPLFGLREYVSDLDAVRLHLGQARIHLLGHSWGGLVCLFYAIRHRRHVASLTLVGSMSPFHEDNRSGQTALQDRIAELTALGLIADPLPSNRCGSCRATSLALLPAYLGDPKLKTPEPLKQTSFSTQVYRFTVDRLGGYDMRSKLIDFVAPTTVFVGHLDPFGIDRARATARALGGAFPEMVVLPRVGHYPWLENDAFMQELRALMQRRLSHAGFAPAR